MNNKKIIFGLFASLAVAGVGTGIGLGASKVHQVNAKHETQRATIYQNMFAHSTLSVDELKKFLIVNGVYAGTDTTTLFADSVWKSVDDMKKADAAIKKVTEKASTLSFTKDNIKVAKVGENFTITVGSATDGVIITFSSDYEMKGIEIKGTTYHKVAAASISTSQWVKDAMTEFWYPIKLGLELQDKQHVPSDWDYSQKNHRIKFPTPGYKA